MEQTPVWIGIIDVPGIVGKSDQVRRRPGGQLTELARLPERARAPFRVVISRTSRALRPCN